jgi:hypothetical protein
MKKTRRTGRNRGIEKKLKAYSALAAGILAMGGSADAQIIYTDIDPDKVIETGSYMLDLNNDGKADFEINQINGSTSGTGSSGGLYFRRVEITPVDTVNKILDVSSDSPYPAALMLNASIGPVKKDWNHYPQVMNSSYSRGGQKYHYGEWNGVTDRYLGLYITVEGKKYYGWARLDVNKDASGFTIKDYAYNSNSEEKISAGDNGEVGISKNELSLNTIIYSHYKDLYVRFANSEKLNGRIELYGLTGEIIKSAAISDKENHFLLEDISSGIYILNISTPKGSFSKKIRIE